MGGVVLAHQAWSEGGHGGGVERWRSEGVERCGGGREEGTCLSPPVPLNE